MSNRTATESRADTIKRQVNIQATIMSSLKILIHGAGVHRGRKRKLARANVNNVIQNSARSPFSAFAGRKRACTAERELQQKATRSSLEHTWPNLSRLCVKVQPRWRKHIAEARELFPPGPSPSLKSQNAACTAVEQFAARGDYIQTAARREGLFRERANSLVDLESRPKRYVHPCTLAVIIGGTRFACRCSRREDVPNAKLAGGRLDRLADWDRLRTGAE